MNIIESSKRICFKKCAIVRILCTRYLKVSWISPIQEAYNSNILLNLKNTRFNNESFRHHLD